ncbi:uncharacterized protein LOC111104440 [Crassostrea virginica]
MKLLSTVLFLTTCNFARSCNPNTVLQCWQESSVAEIINKFSSAQTLKTLNAQYAVEEYCRAQTKLDLCMQDFKQNCSMADTLSLDTAVSAGNFLCSTGKQGFINNFHCLMSSSFQTSTRTCMTDILDLTTNASIASAEGRDISAAKCRTAEEAYTCVEGKTSTTCGEAATEFIHHYLEATMQPLMRDVTCNHSHAPNAEETTSHAHHAKSTCPKHCYKYPETTNTPVLESTKRNMDVWCTENCKLGNCPPTMCTCDCRVPTQALVCNPVSKKFGANYDGAKWCHNTCSAGHCPKEYCDCHILYSLPRPVT